MKFAICLDDNNILVDNFANNSIDGKINKRDYGKPAAAIESCGKKWEKEKCVRFAAFLS